MRNNKNKKDGATFLEVGSIVTAQWLNDFKVWWITNLDTLQTNSSVCCVLKDVAFSPEVRQTPLQSAQNGVLSGVLLWQGVSIAEWDKSLQRSRLGDLQHIGKLTLTSCGGNLSLLDEVGDKVENAELLLLTKDEAGSIIISLLTNK